MAQKSVRLLIPKISIVTIILTSSLSCNKSNPANAGADEQGKLVFVMNDSTIGPWGVYTMNLDGSKLRPVAVSGDSVFFPGPWGNYYILDNYYPLSSPRWNRDGTRIVCQLMWAFEGYVIMVMNSDGSNKHVLWKVRAAALKPQWSPEGDKILFMRSGYLGVVYALGVVDSSGENDRDIPDIAYAWGSTQTFEVDTIWTYGPVGDYQWEQSGNLIYARTSVNVKPDLSYTMGLNSAVEIFSFDVQTGLIKDRLTRNTLDESGFLFSQQAQKVAFLRGTYGGTDNVIHLLSMVDGNRAVIEFGGTIASWSWANDGKKIVYSKDEDPNLYRNTDFHLYVVDVTKPTIQKRLTTFKAVEPDLFIATE
jgi:Tol biopolymer transport system component